MNKLMNCLILLSFIAACNNNNSDKKTEMNNKLTKGSYGYDESFINK
jgi:hypothetical protein